MALFVYVVRSPTQTLSPALFSRDPSTLVLSLENPRLPGKVIGSPQNAPHREGETLSYDEIIKILLGSKKIVAL